MAKSVYEIVQEKFIKAIEEAINTGKKLPWKKPWVGCKPMNYITRRPYRGVNMFLLDPGEYITFTQIQKLREKNSNIKLKKGCKKEMVVFWKMIEKNEGTQEDKKELIPLLRFYYVYNINDVEGIESKLSTHEHQEKVEAEEIVSDFLEREELKLKISKGSDRAFYSPLLDEITMPDKSQFTEIDEYYSTLFHEVAHSTGNPKRLNRYNPNNIQFGNELYSKEELVAELTSSMILNTLGIENKKVEDNSTAYLLGWLSAIKKDVKLIVQASAQAQRAADLILNEKGEELEEEEKIAM